MKINIEYSGFQKKQLEKLKGNFDYAQLTLSLAMDSKTMITERTLKGIDINGKAFKVYSKTPMYISKNTKGLKSYIKPVGKTGQKKFRNGKPHKAQYFALGYYEFRAFTGRGVDSDRLSFSGKMLKSMSAKQNGNNAILYFQSNEEALKAQGNQAKYNFFGLSIGELKIINTTLKNWYAKTIKEGLKNG